MKEIREHAEHLSDQEYVDRIVFTDSVKRVDSMESIQRNRIRWTSRLLIAVGLLLGAYAIWISLQKYF